MRIAALALVTVSLVVTTLRRSSTPGFAPWSLWREAFPRAACRWGEVVGGLAGGAALVTVPLAVSYAIGAIAIEPTHVVATTVIPGIGASVVLIVMWAAVEEFLFRATLIPWMAAFTGTRVALVLSACVFAMAHVGGRDGRFEDALSVAVWVVDGLAFGLAYVATRALWLPTLLHVGKNLMVWLVVGGSSLALTPGICTATYRGASVLAGSSGSAGWLDVVASMVLALFLAVVAVRRGRLAGR